MCSDASCVRAVYRVYDCKNRAAKVTRGVRHTEIPGNHLRNGWLDGRRVFLQWYHSALEVHKNVIIIMYACPSITQSHLELIRLEDCEVLWWLVASGAGMTAAGLKTDRFPYQFPEINAKTTATAIDMAHSTSATTGDVIQPHFRQWTSSSRHKRYGNSLHIMDS